MSQTLHGLLQAMGVQPQQQQAPTGGLANAGAASAGLSGPSATPAMNAPGHMNHGAPVEAVAGQSTLNKMGQAFHQGQQQAFAPVQYAGQGAPVQAQLQNNQAGHVGMGSRFRGLMGVM